MTESQDRWSAGLETAVVVAVGLAVLVGAVACGSTRPRNVPDVTGRRLDLAENALDARRLRYRAVGGGELGIAIRSHWTVCAQNPRPGKAAISVTLFVGRTCRTVPDVVGEPLDLAEEEIEALGLKASEQSVEGDPVLVDQLWVVCSQSPAPGTRAGAVDLHVAYDC